MRVQPGDICKPGDAQRRHVAQELGERLSRRPGAVRPRIPMALCLLVPENVYAATFLLDRIKSTQIRAQVMPLMAKARREIRNGNVSEQTLNWLVSLQPTR